jgi:uncharacterized protein YciI
MAFFVCRLVPPRPGFALDMSAEEAALMGRHAAYWQAAADAGRVVVFGPVLDPKGPWGFGLCEADSAEEAGAFLEQDPAIAAGVGFSYEILPMMTASFGRRHGEPVTIREDAPAAQSNGH